MDWKERLIELSCDYDLKDKEVSKIINQEYGMDISDDSVRYHARRKNKKTAQKIEQVNSGILRTLVISDLHIPFHREEEIIGIVLKHRDEVDTIIFGGDTIDCESISKFEHENRRSLMSEMIVTYKLLKRIDKLTPNVKKILIWGNHEYRYVSYLAREGNELNPMHSDNILQEIVGGFTHFDRVTKRKTVYPPLSDNFEVINKWFYQQGDTIVAHPKNFSKVNLKTLVTSITHFIKRGFSFNTLLIGHTHKWGTTTEYSIWGCELGCLCKPMEYADSGNTGYTPQQYGYVVLVQKNGITDVNASRLYRLDLEEGEQEWQETVDPS